ncbi:MAG: hypothetical protein HDR31_01345 [Mycoplasma sp.]|nr:hypothetical protein [Mycoplasma sp.]
MKNSKWQLFEKKEQKIEINSSFKDNYYDCFYEKNIFNIFNSNLKKEHVLCVGQVQSGKTKNIENAIDYAVKNNYKLIIVFAGITKILYKQTNDRISKNIFYEKKVKFINNIKNLNLQIYLEKNDTVILSILKWSIELKNMFHAIDLINWETKKVLIIDDECDYASINISYDDSINSTTFQVISNLYKRFYNVKLLSFTGTPFANIISSNNGILGPNRIVNLINYKEYCGINYFNKYSNIHYIKIDFNKNIISQTLISQCLLLWLISTACALIENPNFKSEFLVNIEIHNQKQLKIMNFIKKSLSIVKYLQNQNINSILDRYGLPKYDEKLLINKIKTIVKKIIEENAFVLLNSESDGENFKSGKNQFCIVVGGFMVSRGFTFDNLTTELFLNIPNGKITVDTLLQRCRWFGNRTLNNRNKFLRIITNEKIVNALKQAEKYVNIFEQGINTTNINDIFLKISYLDRNNNEVESTNAAKRK